MIVVNYLDIVLSSYYTKSLRQNSFHRVHKFRESTKFTSRLTAVGVYSSGN